MKIKMTLTVGDLRAGLVYDLPDEEAQEHLEADHAVKAKDVELVEVTAPSDKRKVFVEGKAKVKDGKRKN